MEQNEIDELYFDKESIIIEHSDEYFDFLAEELLQEDQEIKDYLDGINADFHKDEWEHEPTDNELYYYI
jgi:hypothetical protein